MGSEINVLQVAVCFTGRTSPLVALLPLLLCWKPAGCISTTTSDFFNSALTLSARQHLFFTFLYLFFMMKKGPLKIISQDTASSFFNPNCSAVLVFPKMTFFFLLDFQQMLLFVQTPSFSKVLLGLAVFWGLRLQTFWFLWLPPTPLS